jgi:hypothetical protein
MCTYSSISVPSVALPAQRPKFAGYSHHIIIIIIIIINFNCNWVDTRWQ